MGKGQRTAKHSSRLASTQTASRNAMLVLRHSWGGSTHGCLCCHCFHPVEQEVLVR